jgi:hypothetical protein
MKNLFGLSAALVLCALVSGCGDKDEDTGAEDTSDQQDTDDTGDSEND